MCSAAHSTHLGIPYAHFQRPVFNLLEKDRMWPFPLVEDGEELGYYRTGILVRVQLADTRDKHGPGDTAEEAVDVGVNGASWVV